MVGYRNITDYISTDFLTGPLDTALAAALPPAVDEAIAGPVSDAIASALASALAGYIQFSNLPTHADDAAARLAGLVDGQLYKTPGNVLRALVPVGDGEEPPADTVPTAFGFVDVTGATLSTVYTSNTITIAGIDAPSAITISGGTYSKNGGGYTSSAGTVVVGDTVAVRLTSSGSNSTGVSATLTVGGVSDTYTVTTLAEVVEDVPAAPQDVIITSPNNDNTIEISFALDAPVVGDWVKWRLSNNGGSTWTAYTFGPHQLTQTEIDNNAITGVFSGTPLADATYLIQMAHSRDNVTYSAWSASSPSHVINTAGASNLLTSTDFLNAYWQAEAGTPGTAVGGGPAGENVRNITCGATESNIMEIASDANWHAVTSGDVRTMSFEVKGMDAFLQVVFFNNSNSFVDGGWVGFDIDGNATGAITYFTGSSGWFSAAVAPVATSNGFKRVQVTYTVPATAGITKANFYAGVCDNGLLGRQATAGAVGLFANPVLTNP